MFKLTLIINLTAVAWSYQKFQMEIPNGMTVPNPCEGQTGTMWPGVGHNMMPGGGTNNQFGLVGYFRILYFINRLFLYQNIDTCICLWYEFW
jgi:hypothetical protein